MSTIDILSALQVGERVDNTTFDIYWQCSVEMTANRHNKGTPWFVLQSV